MSDSHVCRMYSPSQTYRKHQTDGTNRFEVTRTSLPAALEAVTPEDLKLSGTARLASATLYRDCTTNHPARSFGTKH